MKEDIITRILDRNNLNEAFKNVKANKGTSIKLGYQRLGKLF